MLADLCAALGVRAVGVRWPAVGPAVLLAETTPTPHPAFQAPIPISLQAPGLFWADGETQDEDLLRLTANVLAHAPAFRRCLGPVLEQARIAQRLEDAGRVAGRVAHDLDNVFQAVTGFAALGLEALQPGWPAYQNLKEVENAARDGLKFCAQLHQLSRGGQARPLPATVAAALAREISRLHLVFPAVRFEVDATANLPPAAMESGGLQVVLGLLLDNAAEASPTNGIVRVVVRLVEITPEDLRGLLGSPAAGPHLEVKISDQGPGLSDDAQRRMFVEPFFTTKTRHRGLGLSVVYRMLYAHRGGVQAEGPPGRGTTIRVVFPLAAARVPAVEPRRTIGGSVS